MRDGLPRRQKEEIIENFLRQLGGSKGLFFIVCGKCGVVDKLSEKNQGKNIDQEITGVYSDYTGHLWDTVNIKCLKCGNAMSFDK